MRLLLDACYTPDIARLLRERGWDAVSALAREELREAPDPELLAVAIAEHRALVSNDAGGFVPLTVQAARESRDHYGLLLSSDRSMPRSRKTMGLYVRVLDALLDEHQKDDALLNRIIWLKPT